MKPKGFLAAFTLGLMAGSSSAQEFTRTGTVEVKRVVVEGEMPSAYTTPNAVTATKTDTPVLDVPQSIITITRQVIDDQQDVTLGNALRNSPGVSVGGSVLNSDLYRLRGFDASGHTFLDGLMADTEFQFPEELFGLDRVEVLLGPASVLYGQGPAGGLVNLISKTPAKATFAQVFLEGGSYGEFEAGLDLNTPLNARGSVYGRINLAYHQLGVFAEGTELSRRFFFAPSVTLELSRHTRLTLLGQFYETWISDALGLPAEGTVLPNPNGRFSIYRNPGEPDTYPTRTDGRRGYVGYQLEHRFNDVFALRQNVRAGFFKEQLQSTYNITLDPDGRTLERGVFHDPDVYQTVEADTTLTARCAVGSWINQTALGGVDFYYFHDHYQDFYNLIAPLDLFQPHYGASIPDFIKDYDLVQETTATGLYCQDQIEFFHRLTLVMGARGDFVTNDLSDRYAHTNDDRSDRAFSPRAGAVYEISPKTLSAYFSWNRSFLTAPLTPSFDGQPIPPERGEQYEVGLKADAIGGRLTGLLAFYHITRTNVPTPDPVRPDFFVATGEQRHRGVDFDVTYQLMPGWDLLANYSFIDARVTRDNESANVGQRPIGVPEHSVFFWTRYTVRTGRWRGFGAGLGYQYVSAQEGDQANTFSLPSHGLLDLALYYSRGRFKAQINVSNVTNERYYTAYQSALDIKAGNPVSALATTEWRY